jgi:Toprim domain
MVALVRGVQSDAPQAVHRTALTDTSPPQRIDRLSLGPVAGGAIKLSLDGDVTHGLLIGEGIETTLSASLILKFRPAWSVVSRNGIAKFPILTGIEAVTIAVDNDPDGQAAAATLVERLTLKPAQLIRRLAKISTMRSGGQSERPTGAGEPTPRPLCKGASTQTGQLGHDAI